MGKKQIQCKMCTMEMDSKAKKCPSCGAKNKKPVFKKWWFWAIILFIAIGSASSGESDTPTTSGSKNDTEDVVKDTVSNENGDTSTSTDTSKETSNATTGQKNALKAAKGYLSYSAFSYDGLIKQLEFEKYSNEDAVYAADNCGADWNEQAAKAAKAYLEYSAFSRDSLIGQLEFEGFTNEQAVYGADAAYGSDTGENNSSNEASGETLSQQNALKAAQSYLSYSAFSYDGLIEQLEFEKYSNEDAVYAANNCGADWNEQAVKAAKSYLDYSSFSRDGLIEQLQFEGFTYEQAVYGAEENGY